MPLREEHKDERICDLSQNRKERKEVHIIFPFCHLRSATCSDYNVASTPRGTVAAAATSEATAAAAAAIAGATVAAGAGRVPGEGCGVIEPRYMIFIIYM